MSKQPHVIITMGRQSGMMRAAAPENYSIEAYGYSVEDVLRLTTAVHDLARPIEDTDSEPIPFTLGGFTLVSKLPDGTANPFAHMFKPEAHDGENDELDRCGCDTDTPPAGDLHVRINSVNHRFRNIAEARRFALRWKLVPESVFAHPLDDEELCCFPYAFQMADGSNVGFQTEVFAQYMAVQNGLTPEDVMYHADEHRPEHKARFDAQAAWLGAMSSPDPSDDHDAQPDDATEAPTLGEEFAGLAEALAEQAAATTEDETPGCEGHETTQGAIGDVYYCDGTCVPRNIPGQRTDATERDIVQQLGCPTHPNPCLPGCSCGNGPAPLATEPADG